MGSLRLGSVIGAGVVVVASLVGCTSDPAQASGGLDVHAESAATAEGPTSQARPIVGLYRSVAELTPVAPTTDTLPTLRDFVVLEDSGTGVGIPGNHHFQSVGAAAAGGFPSNAIATLLTWRQTGTCLETRILRPIFVPTPATSPSGTPAQVYIGYLRGKFELQRQADGTWEGSAQVEVVQLLGLGPTTCQNDRSGPPCVTRAYEGTLALEPIDPWDQADQPHVPDFM